MIFLNVILLMISWCLLVQHHNSKIIRLYHLVDYNIQNIDEDNKE